MTEVPGLHGLVCSSCGWPAPGHHPGCSNCTATPVADPIARHANRVAAEAHADLRLQFALVLVKSGRYVPFRDSGFTKTEVTEANATAWAKAVFSTADALAAENARLRKAEGL